MHRIQAIRTHLLKVGTITGRSLSVLWWDEWLWRFFKRAWAYLLFIREDGLSFWVIEVREAASSSSSMHERNFVHLILDRAAGISLGKGFALRDDLVHTDPGCLAESVQIRHYTTDWAWEQSSIEDLPNVLLGMWLLVASALTQQQLGVACGPRSTSGAAYKKALIPNSPNP